MTTDKRTHTAASSEAQRTLLVLGAGLMQRPAIEAARSLDCQVVVVDGNHQALCVPLADQFFPLDLKDKEGIKELAPHHLSVHPRSRIGRPHCRRIRQL